MKRFVVPGEHSLPTVLQNSKCYPIPVDSNPDEDVVEPVQETPTRGHNRKTNAVPHNRVPSE